MASASASKVIGLVTIRTISARILRMAGFLPLRANQDEREPRIRLCPGTQQPTGHALLVALAFPKRTRVKDNEPKGSKPPAHSDAFGLMNRFHHNCRGATMDADLFQNVESRSFVTADEH
jgi:hypothetical protein